MSQLFCGFTDDTERLPGEAEAALPASVAAAAASAPYPDDVLQTKHYNHHKLLQDRQTHTFTRCSIVDNGSEVPRSEFSSLQILLMHKEFMLNHI